MQQAKEEFLPEGFIGYCSRCGGYILHSDLSYARLNDRVVCFDCMNDLTGEKSE